VRVRLQRAFSARFKILSFAMVSVVRVLSRVASLRALSGFKGSMELLCAPKAIALP